VRATPCPSASAAGDKAARLMQLCNAFGLPLLSLVDTPGMMVGPAAEETGLVRHTCRLPRPRALAAGRGAPLRRHLVSAPG
jgi:hypothetical protein